MSPLLFVIADMDGDDDDPVLFWSNEDGWVSWGTPGIAEYTATETETLRLPMGLNVTWVSRMSARELVKQT